MKRSVILAGFALSLAVSPGLAQGAGVLSIAGDAGYELSLRCYQYYDVEGQIAQARGARAKAGSPEADQFAKRLNVVRPLKSAWNRNIDRTKEARAAAVIDQDLARVGAPIIADANAGLSGDKGAVDRMEALHGECEAKEIISGR